MGGYEECPFFLALIILNLGVVGLVDMIYQPNLYYNYEFKSEKYFDSQWKEYKICIWCFEVTRRLLRIEIRFKVNHDYGYLEWIYQTA